MGIRELGEPPLGRLWLDQQACALGLQTQLCCSRWGRSGCAVQESRTCCACGTRVCSWYGTQGAAWMCVGVGWRWMGRVNGMEMRVAWGWQRYGIH